MEENTERTIYIKSEKNTAEQQQQHQLEREPRVKWMNAINLICSENQPYILHCPAFRYF